MRKERMFPRVHTRKTKRFGKGIRPFENIELENLYPKPLEEIKENRTSETQEKSSLKMKQNFSLISDRQYVTAVCFDTAAPFFNALKKKFFKPNCSQKKQTS